MCQSLSTVIERFESSNSVSSYFEPSKTRSKFQLCSFVATQHRDKAIVACILIFDEFEAACILIFDKFEVSIFITELFTLFGMQCTLGR